MLKNIEAGVLLRFFNIHSVAKYQNFKRDPLETLKSFQKKTNENFEKSHIAKKSERGGLWDFLTSIMLRKIKK